MQLSSNKKENYSSSAWGMVRTTTEPPATTNRDDKLSHHLFLLRTRNACICVMSVSRRGLFSLRKAIVESSETLPLSSFRLAPLTSQQSARNQNIFILWFLGTLTRRSFAAHTHTHTPAKSPNERTHPTHHMHISPPLPSPTNTHVLPGPLCSLPTVLRISRAPDIVKTRQR